MCGPGHCGIEQTDKYNQVAFAMLAGAKAAGWVDRFTACASVRYLTLG